MATLSCPEVSLYDFYVHEEISDANLSSVTEHSSLVM
jgi:hypothetical protein